VAEAALGGPGAMWSYCRIVAATIIEAMAPPKKRAAPKRKPTKARKPAKVRKPKRPAPSSAPERGVHDLGGLPGGRIDRAPHALSPFEERVDAMMMVLTNQCGIYKVDSLRRTIESMSAKEYRDLAYYEKWMLGIRRMLVEQGVLTDAEIDAKVKQIERSLAAGAAP
jgi:hypothetical protein